MFLRNSKILLLIWVLWLAASSLCLALDQHSCCPTETADWHMDTLQNYIRIEPNTDLEASSEVVCPETDPDCKDNPECLELEVEENLPPPFSLQTKSIFQSLAPPIA